MRARRCRSADPRLHPTTSQARPIGSLTTCCPLITVCLCLRGLALPLRVRTRLHACKRANKDSSCLPEHRQR